MGENIRIGDSGLDGFCLHYGWIDGFTKRRYDRYSDELMMIMIYSYICIVFSKRYQDGMRDVLTLVYQFCVEFWLASLLACLLFYIHT